MERPFSLPVLWWLGALGLAAWLLGAGSAPDDARALYREGVRAFRAGQMDEARDLFRRSEASDPTYPFPIFAQGRIYQELFEQQNRHYETAVGAYERLSLLLEAHPPADRDRALYQAFYHQGVLYLRGREPRKALEALDRFLSVYRDFYNLQDVYNARGVSLFQLDRYDEAVDAFREAITLKPEFAEAKVNLRSVFTRLAVYDEARACHRSGDLDGALDHVRRLRGIAPGYLPGLRLEGDVLQGMNRADEALCAYQEVLSEDPTAPITHGVRLEVAHILEGRGQRREALGVLNENVRYFRDVPRDPTRTEILRLLNLLRGAP